MSELDITAFLRETAPAGANGSLRYVVMPAAQSNGQPDTRQESPLQYLGAVRGADVSMRSIRWLEKPTWQQAAFQLFAGAKGVGKGTCLAALAVRVLQKGGTVMFISSEDSMSIDAVPRLVAAGATPDDLARVVFLTQNTKLPDCIDWIRGAAEEIGGISLLVIDPVANHIGNNNSNSDAEVRYAIAPLNSLADELDCLLIGVRHIGKDRTRGALASVLGSTAWVDTPRAVVMVAKDDEDEAIRHIQVVAGNRAPNGSAEAFRIEAVPVPGLDEPITCAIPLGTSTKNIDDLLAPGEPTRRVSGETLQALVLRELTTGDKARTDLDTIAKTELGANPDSVYKYGLDPLRVAGRVKAFKTGIAGGWHWTLTLEERTEGELG